MSQDSTTLDEIRSFVQHLRLPFQLLVAPVSFLLGLFFAGGRFSSSLLPFLAVHLCYLGGTTVFNSYYDHDSGPIEGLDRPLPLAAWTLPASCALQGLGLALVARQGAIAILVLGLGCFAFSFLYNHPSVRWKGRPLLSLLVIGICGSTVPFLIGSFTGQGLPGSSLEILAASGALLIVVATFPLAQAHQTEEDLRRGDRTFSAHFGAKGVRALFHLAYPLGVALLSIAFLSKGVALSILILFLGIGAGIPIWIRLRTLRGDLEDYYFLTRTKAFAAMGFNLALIVLIVLGGAGS